MVPKTIHHVRPRPAQTAWDLGFLAWGVVFALAGGTTVKASSRRPTRETGTRRYDPADPLLRPPRIGLT